MNTVERVAVITGGASGIGRKTAELLLDSGVRTVIGDLVEVHGNDRLVFQKTDITKGADITALMNRAIDTFGRIDILVNCAGIASLSKIPDITPEEWDKIFAVNLKAAFFCSQAALEYMCKAKKGTIINIASAAAKLGGVAVGAHYSASKAGIICLTKSLALYGAPFGVTANCVCPGPTETPLTDTWGQALNAEFADKIPLKRYAQPEEVADVVCFLASPRSGYITGETIDVNGGLVMD